MTHYFLFSYTAKVPFPQRRRCYSEKGRVQWGPHRSTGKWWGAADESSVQPHTPTTRTAPTPHSAAAPVRRPSGEEQPSSATTESTTACQGDTRAWSAVRCSVKSGICISTWTFTAWRRPTSASAGGRSSRSPVCYHTEKSVISTYSSNTKKNQRRKPQTLAHCCLTISKWTYFLDDRTTHSAHDVVATLNQRQITLIQRRNSLECPLGALSYVGLSLLRYHYGVCFSRIAIKAHWTDVAFKFEENICGLKFLLHMAVGLIGNMTKN